MGYYINPETGTKEQWLDENAKVITIADVRSFDFSSDRLPVVLVDNGPFTAAGIAYDARERDAFLVPDYRPKVWYSATRDSLKEWYNK